MDGENDEDLTFLTFRNACIIKKQVLIIIKVEDISPQPPSYFRVTGVPWKENPFPQSTQALLCCQT